MNKLFDIFSIIAILGMFSCQSSIKQVELDKLNNQIVEKDSFIEELKYENYILSLNLENCLAKNKELETQKKTTTTTAEDKKKTEELILGRPIDTSKMGATSGLGASAPEFIDPDKKKNASNPYSVSPR